MSAIFGIVNLNGAPVDREYMNRMSEALAHHGSEGGGIWSHGSVGLGLKLRRFTPSDFFESQPFSSPDGQLHIVSDGRIDNRTELIEMMKSGMRKDSLLDGDPSSIPDSVLILRAYELWGQDCVKHLIGVFAFAVWDGRSRQLFAARSPIVAPTLLYSWMSGTLAFSTAPGGLHALPFIPRALCEQHLAELLVEMRGNGDDTLYRNILRLKTGHRLIAGYDGLKIDCFWQPDTGREIRFKRDEEYFEAFHDLFQRVVDDSLRSCTPVALQMSGGLDSSSIAAVAAPLLGRRGERLTAFTEVPRTGFSGALPKGKYADETPLVQAVAGMYPNLDLNLVHTDGQIFLNDLDRLFFHLERPFRNTSNRVWIEAILQESSRRGIRVLLDGVPGNLTMSWNGDGLLPELILGGKWAEALNQTAAIARNDIARSSLRVLLGQGILPLLPDPLYSAITRLRYPELRTSRPWRTFSPIHPCFESTQRVVERARESGYSLRYRPVSDMRSLRLKAVMSQDFAIYSTAYRAMYGVETRSPAADVRIVEFCLALPENQFLRDGESRRLIRSSMKGHLPETVLANRKRGLQAADWFERLAGARPLVLAELERLKRSDLARRVLDLERMDRLVRCLPAGDVRNFESISEYQVLQRGLMTGRFLCWFEEGSRRQAPGN